MSEPRASAAQRRAVAARARHRCEYCGIRAEFSSSPFCIEHITPQAAGGPTKLDNLAFACGGCNAHKGDKTKALDPATGDFAALFHPRKDDWTAHFAWSESTLLLVGLTPVGRATVHGLRLNRTPLVNLRRLLRSAHEHPSKPGGD